MFNNQNLPFSPDMIQYNQVGNPNAQQFMGAVNIQDLSFLQELLNALATEIYNNVNKNQVRVFHFNQCAANNWANNDFLELVNFTIQYIQHGQQSGMRGTLQEYVSYAVKLFASNNLAKFSALQQYCSQEALNEAAQHVQTLQGIIGNMRQASQMPMMNRGGFQGQQNTGFGGAPSIGRNFNTNTGINTSTQGFMSAPKQEMPNIGGGFNKWDNMDTSTMNKPQEIIQEPPKLPVNETDEVSASEGWSNWYPTLEVPYIPAVRYRDYAISFKRDNNKFIPVIRERDKSSMDYKAHLIPTSYGFLPREFGKNLMTEETSVKAIMAGAKVIGQDVKTDLYEMVVNPNLLLDVGMDQVWFDASLDRLSAAKNGQTPSKVYHTIAVTAMNPIIDSVDHTAWVSDIRNSRTLSELRARIVAALDIIPKQLWRVLDRRLTDKLRRVLVLQMGIPTLNFDSFTEDYEDVVKAIETKHGEVFRELLEKHQLEIIRSAIGVLDDESAETLTSASGGEGERNYKVTYIARRVTLTLLDFTVHELSIEVPSQVGVAITQDQAPEFHRLATEILKLHDSESNPTEAHFIRTSDYYTFEIARGYLGKDFITMMLHRDQ